MKDFNGISLEDIKNEFLGGTEPDDNKPTPSQVKLFEKLVPDYITTLERRKVRIWETDFNFRECHGAIRFSFITITDYTDGSASVEMTYKYFFGSRGYYHYYMRANPWNEWSYGGSGNIHHR